MQYYITSNTVMYDDMAKGNLSKLAPECLHCGFYWH